MKCKHIAKTTQYIRTSLKVVNRSQKNPNRLHTDLPMSVFEDLSGLQKCIFSETNRMCFLTMEMISVAGHDITVSTP